MSVLDCCAPATHSAKALPDTYSQKNPDFVSLPIFHLVTFSRSGFKAKEDSL